MPELMMLGTLPFPNIDPVLVEIGPIAIRWYSLAYIAGLFLGWWYVTKLLRLKNPPMARQHADDFLLWATAGVILGGRLGYVLFYNLERYLAEPLDICRLWDGGMSFHGGFLGVAIAVILYTRRKKLDLWKVSDLIACVAPIGLFLGRLANFINGELFGRPSDVPWAMVFPDGGAVARHPSQLYEATLEGLALFCVLWFLVYRTNARFYPGLLTGVFLTGYGASRIFVEFFREPDAHLQEIWGFTTMGQILSLPMLIAGLFLIFWSLRGRSAKQKPA